VGEDDSQVGGNKGEFVSATLRANKVVGLTNIKVRFDDEMVINEGEFIVGLINTATTDIEVSISLVERPL
jgi:hypothetical protein